MKTTEIIRGILGFIVRWTIIIGLLWLLVFYSGMFLCWFANRYMDPAEPVELWLGMFAAGFGWAVLILWCKVKLDELPTIEEHIERTRREYKDVR